jgi:hypothetical protein
MVCMSSSVGTIRVHGKDNPRATAPAVLMPEHYAPPPAPEILQSGLFFLRATGTMWTLKMLLVTPLLHGNTYHRHGCLASPEACGRTRFSFL